MARYAQLTATGIPSGVPVTIKQNGKQVSNLFPAADATAPDNRARTGTRSGALSPATFVPNGTYSVEWSGGGALSVTVSGAAGLPPAIPFDMATQAELDASGAGLAGAYAPKADPAFTGTMGLPGGSAGNPRLPVNGLVTMDGSTLPPGTSDKVAFELATVFKGGFGAEAGYGQANPGFLFGLNSFNTTGNQAGDLAGINDLYGVLGEMHVYTPGATLFKAFGMSAEAALEASAVGTTITTLTSLYARGPVVKAGTVTGQAVSLRIDPPEVTAPGAVTGLNLGMWCLGAALFEGNTPQAQGVRQGVYVGGGQFNGGDPGIEFSDGTNTWRIDNTAGVLRFVKPGVAVRATLSASGDLALPTGSITAVGTSSLAALTLSGALSVAGGITSSGTGDSTFSGAIKTLSKNVEIDQGTYKGRSVIVSATPTDASLGRFTVYSNAAGNCPAFIRGFSGQTADLIRWEDSGAVARARVSGNGAYVTKANAAPADADLAAGEMAVWFDSTNGASKLMVKAKQQDGTVKTGSLALA